MSSISTSTLSQELLISPATYITDVYRISTNSSQNLGAPSAEVEFHTYIDAFFHVSGATLTTIFPLALPVFSFCIACGACSNESCWSIIVLTLPVSIHFPICCKCSVFAVNTAEKARQGLPFQVISHIPE